MTMLEICSNEKNHCLDEYASSQKFLSTEKNNMAAKFRVTVNLSKTQTYLARLQSLCTGGKTRYDA